MFHTGHNTSFDDFETLVKESDECRLLLRESLLILRDDPPLNRYVKGQYTYDVHENCLIFKTPPPPHPSCPSTSRIFSPP